MRIAEFAKKYEVDRRSIDYWTNIGLLHPDDMVGKGRGYRIYGEKAEEEIKRILIARAMGASPLEEYVDMLNHLPKELWRTFVVKQIENEIDRVTKDYKQALK